MSRRGSPAPYRWKAVSSFHATKVHHAHQLLFVGMGGPRAGGGGTCILIGSGALLPHWMEETLSEFQNWSPPISPDRCYLLRSVLQTQVRHLGSCICKAPKISISFGWCFIKWHLKKHCKARRDAQRVLREPWSFFHLRVLKIPFSRWSQCVLCVKIPIPRIRPFGHFLISGRQCI